MYFRDPDNSNVSEFDLDQASILIQMNVPTIKFD